MLRPFYVNLSQATCLLVAFTVGCDTAPSPNNSATAPATPAAKEHDHPSEGPHHGDLVELGNEEYHAEVVHGKEGEVTVYILDGKAAKAVPIAATEVTINLSHDGKAEQFKLAAAPEAGEPAGTSSRFAIKDAELASDLDAEGTKAKIVLQIDGKSYTGAIAHDHKDGDHTHKKGE